MAEEPCRVCAVRAADYRPHMICRECRNAMAEVALTGSDELIATLWLVTADFGDRRKQVLFLNRGRADVPRPEVVASVARGLLEQGYVDDGLVLSALAIKGGEGADINQVGASALGVMFDPLLAQSGIALSLRVALYGS